MRWIIFHLSRLVMWTVTWWVGFMDDRDRISDRTEWRNGR